MMTPQRMLFRLAVRTLEWITLHDKPTAICHLPLEPLAAPSVDVITVAFNNVHLIRLQEQFLQKFLTDRYTHIVADNSTNPAAREEIYRFCLEQGIAYVGLPANRLNRIGGSYSHATALNYIFRHIITKRRPTAFGQIDHDLFPTAPVSLLQKLESQPVYGPLRLRDECWYLSAILSFFRYDFVADKRVDFMPVTPGKRYLDSGGGNWYDLYSRLDRAKIVFPNECIEPLRAGGDRHCDSLEFFDDKLWIHTINGSCWKPVPAEEEKNQLVKQHLEAILSAPVPHSTHHPKC